MSESRLKNTAKNASAGLRFTLVSTLLSFASRTVFIKVLGEACLGLNGLFTAILSLFSLAELGIGQAITFYLYKPIAEQDQHRLSQLVKFYKFCYRIIGVAIAILGVAIIPWLPRIIDLSVSVGFNITHLYLLYLANTVMTYLFFSYPQTVLAANQKQYIVTNCGAVFSLISFTLECLVLVFTKNYIYYLYTKLMVGLTQNCVIAIIAFKKYPYLRTRKAENIKLSEIRVMFKDVYSIFIVKLSSKLFTATDNLFISVMFGTILVGYNSNYVMIINAVSGVAYTIINACSGSVGNLIASASKETVVSRFELIDFVNFCVSAFCGICLFELLNPFISLVWGKGMTFSLFAVVLICINFYIVASLNVVFIFRQGMGLFRYYAYNQLIAALVNIVLNVLLGSLIGIEGLFMATVIANVGFAVVPFVKNLFNVGFEMSSKMQIRRMVARTAYVIAVAFGLHLLCNHMPDTIGWFAVRVLTVGSISCLSLLLAGLKEKKIALLLAYANSLLRR